MAQRYTCSARADQAPFRSTSNGVFPTPSLWPCTWIPESLFFAKASGIHVKAHPAGTSPPGENLIPCRARLHSGNASRGCTGVCRHKCGCSVQKRTLRSPRSALWQRSSWAGRTRCLLDVTAKTPGLPRWLAHTRPPAPSLPTEFARARFPACDRRQIHKTLAYPENPSGSQHGPPHSRCEQREGDFAVIGSLHQHFPASAPRGCLNTVSHTGLRVTYPNFGQCVNSETPWSATLPMPSSLRAIVPMRKPIGINGQ